MSSRIFRLALVLVFVLVVFAYAKAGTPRVDLSPVVKVRVFSTPKPGKWYSHMGTIHSFSDANIFACFEWIAKPEVECLVIASDGETLLMPLYLLEIKT